MFYFLIGSCLGSFFCVVAQRVPLKQSFLFSRSRCDHCQQSLRSWELIPIVSSLLLRFRCQRCGQSFSRVIWLAELVYGGIFYYCWLQSAFSDQLIAWIWLTTVFLLSLTDLFYLTVEPKFLYPGHALLWGICLYLQLPFYWETLGITLMLAVFFWLYLHYSMGLGDLLLLICWAPWLSPQEFSQLLLTASLLALMAFALHWFIQRERIKQLPFVPFLSVALFLVYFL
ncbi:prepilin peptidase [Enterococcus olivae]